MNYHVTGEQAASASAFANRIIEIAQREIRAHEEKKRLRIGSIRPPKQIKVKNANTDIQWAKSLGREAMDLVADGKSITPLVEREKIPRSQVIGYMKRYYGYKPVSACGQKRKEFTEAQVKWAIEQRTAGKSLHQIATGLGVAVSTLRHNIVLPDAPATKSAHK